MLSGQGCDFVVVVVTVVTAMAGRSGKPACRSDGWLLTEAMGGARRGWSGRDDSTDGYRCVVVIIALEASGGKSDKVEGAQNE